MGKAAEVKDVENSKTTANVPWLTSCRFLLGFIGLFGTLCMYAMRANMSVAIVCMTDNGTANGTESQTDDEYWRETYRVADVYPAAKIDIYDNSKKGAFDWSRTLQGWVLSSFFIGYMITSFPGGWFAAKYGAKVVVGAGVGLLSFLTLLTPIAAYLSVYVLIVIQALKGFTSGVYYPAMFQMFGRWTTGADRSFIIAVCMGGDSVGAIVSSILSGLLCEFGFAGGWPSIFYVFGLAGILWCVVWYLLAYSTPQQHPRISRAELEYIHTMTPPGSADKSPPVPWFKLLTSFPVYALCVAELSQGWNFYVALTTLPQFMNDVLKFDMASNGLYNSMPYIVNAIVTVLGSMLADVLVSKKVMRVTWIRKTLTLLGMLPSAFFSVGVAFIPEDKKILAVILVSFWIGLTGFIKSGVNANTVELAPKYSGIVMSTQNIFANLPGFLAPPVVAALTPTRTREQWQHVFLLNAIISVSGLMFYLIFANAEEAEWAKVPDEETEMVHDAHALAEVDHKAREAQSIDGDMDNLGFAGTSDEMDYHHGSYPVVGVLGYTNVAGGKQVTKF